MVVTHLELRFYQLRPYIFPFCQLFQALHLFYLPNFPDPTFISCPKSILESRVDMRNLLEPVKKIVIKNCSDLSLFE